MILRSGRRADRARRLHVRGSGQLRADDDSRDAVSSGPGASGVESVKSIRVDNVEVIDSGVELRSGRDLSDVEIVVTNRVQPVSGIVTNDTRPDLRRTRPSLFFAQNPDLRTTTRFIGQAPPRSERSLPVRNLPPGEYFADRDRLRRPDSTVWQRPRLPRGPESHGPERVHAPGR